MPELPEVETIRRGLEKYALGHTIEYIDTINKGPFQGEVKDIENAKIKAARRIGKGLILDLSNGNSLAIHVKLTGQLIYRDSKTEKFSVSKEKVGTIPNKFTHVIFVLDRGAKLYYNDQRRFGWIKVVKTDKVLDLPFFKGMGPEPFKDLTLEKFKALLKGKTTPVKPFIMDQARIGGIGNIYANDALFRSRVSPKRPAKSLSHKEVQNLYDSIIAVMETSFREGGASELSFVNILGQTGNYQNHSLVYGKKGKRCPRNDGGVIQRITLGGRGTFFCPVCQK